MESQVNLAELIHKGGVYVDVEGSTPQEVYENISKVLQLPEGVTPETLCDALCAREKVLSTAVGNGIALPHARTPVMKAEENQRIVVVYLKNPINMNAPDERQVFVMFILLTQNPQSHLQVLTELAALFRKLQFRKALENKAGEAELINLMRDLN